MNHILRDQHLESALKKDTHRQTQLTSAVQRPAKQRDQAGHHGQCGQGEQHCGEQGRYQITYRVDADHAQRVDLLRNLHGADARGNRRTGATGDKNPGNQRCKFARYRERDTQHHLPFGAKST